MPEILTTATDFFLAHSVVICIILAVLLVVSSIAFLMTLNKRKKAVEKNKSEDKPEIDVLEQMYLDSRAS